MAPSALDSTLPELTGSLAVDLSGARLIDSVPALIWVTDASGMVTLLNRRWYEFTGHSAPADLKDEWLESLHPDDRAPTRQYFEEATSRRAEYYVEYRLRRHDGEYLWCRAAGAPQFDAAGDYLGHVGWCMDIDLIKRSEVEIAELQERFALAIEGAADAIFDWNHIGTPQETIWFAPRLAEILDYDAGEIPLDRPAIAQRLHPADKNVRQLAIESNFSQDRYDAEYRIKNKHGDYKWLRSKGVVIRDEAGRARRMCGSVRDVDEQKRAELAIATLHDKFESAIRGAQAGLWEWDLKNRQAWLSPSCRQLLGYAPDEAFNGGLDFIDVHLHPDDRARVKAAIAAHMRDAEPYDCEYRMRLRDGSYRWFRGRGSATRDTIGRAIRLSGSVIDIHERRLAEIALREEKEKAEVTLASIGDAVISTDAANRVQFINGAAERLLGISPVTAVGKPISEIVTLLVEETGARLEDPVVTCLERNSVVRSQLPSLLRTATGDEYAIEYSASPLRREPDELLGGVLVLKDVTRERNLAREISYHATHDSLTELVNRREFEQRMRRTIDSAQDEQGQHALCFLDLDQFKVINDTCGHVAGDELLREIASILKRHTRQRDTIARLGGDEFGLLMEHCNIEHARRVAETLRQALVQHRFTWEGRRYSIGVSIGVAAIDANSGTVDAVLRQADTACYAAKDAGRNRVHVYEPSDRDMLRRHDEMEWVARINEGFEADHFQLFFQRIEALGPQRETYVELLVRYVNGDMCLAPRHFIPAAERYGLATRLDTWVIERFGHWYATHQAATKGIGWFAINLSGLSLGDPEFKDALIARFDKGTLPADRMCFEITETEAIRNLGTATAFFNTLKTYGCRVALDDFGSGMSSFAYLRELPVDFIKIDGNFVRDCGSDAIAHAMVKSINEIGQVMGKRTIAEWAESTTVVERLRSLGTDYVQGYAIHRPAPLGECGC